MLGQKSQSLNTDQVSSDKNQRLYGWDSREKVTIPQYRSGQFGLRYLSSFVSVRRTRSHNPSIQIRSVRTVVARQPSSPATPSQSLNTDQVSSDAGRKMDDLFTTYTEKSQSLNTDQVSSDMVVLNFASGMVSVTIPQYRSGQFGL